MAKHIKWRGISIGHLSASMKLVDNDSGGEDIVITVPFGSSKVTSSFDYLVDFFNNNALWRERVNRQEVEE